MDGCNKNSEFNWAMEFGSGSFFNNQSLGTILGYFNKKIKYSYQIGWSVIKANSQYICSFLPPRVQPAPTQGRIQEFFEGGGLF